MVIITCAMSKEIRIILVSDNHGLREPLAWLQQQYHDYDAFLHCGDSELPASMMAGFASVQGNNDAYGVYPLHRIIDLGKHHILLTHGHRDFFFGRYDMLAKLAKQNGCDLVCFGHTHVPFDDTIEGIRLLNPGSIWHNRDGSRSSYMRVILDEKKIEAHLERF